MIRGAKNTSYIGSIIKRGLTWQACARLMPTLKRADTPGGMVVGSVFPKPGSITRIHLTTASTINSLLNCLTLSISSLTCLWVINQRIFRDGVFNATSQINHMWNHTICWHSLILHGRTLQNSFSTLFFFSIVRLSQRQFIEETPLTIDFLDHYYIL